MAWNCLKSVFHRSTRPGVATLCSQPASDTPPQLKNIRFCPVCLFLQEASPGAAGESSASGSASCPSQQQALPPLFLPGITICGWRSELTSILAAKLIGPFPHSSIISGCCYALLLSPVCFVLCVPPWSRRGRCHCDSGPLRSGSRPGRNVRQGSLCSAAWRHPGSLFVLHADWDIIWHHRPIRGWATSLLQGKFVSVQRPSVYPSVGLLFQPSPESDFKSLHSWNLFKYVHLKKGVVILRQFLTKSHGLKFSVATTDFRQWEKWGVEKRLHVFLLWFTNAALNQ